MQTIGGALELVVGELSDENYAQSLDFYRFWLGPGQADIQVPPDQVFDSIWNRRVASSIHPDGGIFHPTAHLIPRFASDAESDPILAPYSSELRTRLCTRSLREFSNNNLMVARYGRDTVRQFYADVNLLAHWANLGYLEEAAIRHRVLQSLISHPKLYDHQADALIILFKLAGATFEAYADTSVVDRCFELLRVHNYARPYKTGYPNSDNPNNNNYLRVKTELVQVSMPRAAKCGPGTERFQELVALRKRGWEGLPPPPAFTSGKPKPPGVRQEDPAATPVATSLGLPGRDSEPQILQVSPPASVTVPETGAISASPVISVAQSPSISISTLSDFTITDASDDEPHMSPTFPDTSDDEPLVDPTALAPHETFYLEDGNVEVLCGNTLFRIHVSTLSFHSPALRRMFAQTNLATAESPNGCPRILSSDTAKDFTTLLKIVYLPGFVASLTFRWIVPLTICLSTGSPNGIKYRTSLRSHPSSGSRRSTRCLLSDLRYSR